MHGGKALVKLKACTQSLTVVQVEPRVQPAIRSLKVKSSEMVVEKLSWNKIWTVLGWIHVCLT